jgi:hypothetical protein
MFIQPQAFIDDSVTQPSQAHFVLAGFVSSAANWAAFSDEWKAVLDLAPRLEYFKMHEANILKNEFSSDRGWNEELRDERVLALAKLIKKYALIRIHASIKSADFEKYVASAPVPQRKLISDSPYIYLLIKLITAMAIRSTLYGINEPCDFIFDEQAGFSEEVFAYWPVFRAIIEDIKNPAFPTFLGARPEFKNEKDVRPLQAADLFANQIRYRMEHNLRGSDRLTPALTEIAPIQDIALETNEDDLRRLSGQLVKHQKKYIAENPDTTLMHFAASRRERRLNRKRGKRQFRGASSLKKQSS